MSVWSEIPSYMASGTFPASNGNLGSKELNSYASSNGWKNSWGDIWTSSQKPGQYLSSGNLATLLGKQQEAVRLSNPGTFNPGVDYMALLSPYLSSSGSSGSSNTSAGTPKTALGSSALGINRYKTGLDSLIADPNRIANTESYKFRLSQGQQALQRSAAAKGMLGSGNTLAALMEYGQGMASTEYGNEFDRMLRASQGEDSFALGKANLDLSKASLDNQSQNALMSLILEAGKASSNDYWNAQNLASKNALSTGYLNPNIW